MNTPYPRALKKRKPVRTFMNSFRTLPVLLQVILPACLLPLTTELRASIVTTCDEASLRAAIAQGGTVDFACADIF